MQFTTALYDQVVKSHRKKDMEMKIIKGMFLAPIRIICFTMARVCETVVNLLALILKLFRTSKDDLLKFIHLFLS